MILLAVDGDLHCNSVAGLCPPGFQVHNGDRIQLSAVSTALWESWQSYWQAIDELKRKNRAKCWAVFNGDVCDMNTHDGAGLRSHVRSDIPKMAAETLEVIAGIADRVFVVRGTEAHVGNQGELEESLAAMVGAEPDAATGCNSWWHLPLDVAGVRFSITHHPRITGWLPHTKRQAALRASAAVALQAEERDEMPADVYIRSHTHTFVATPAGMRPMVVYTPGWQLTTAYAYRRGAGDNVEPPGGVWFLCEGGALLDWDAILYWPKRREYWTPH